ncbi:MAG: methionine/alanine import family NSS transporter small subunit [Intrasporangium sp.]|nr:methionine/alanine import family NSS transporter small subunit [Intrasporangium sp.]MDN5797391.1 methionine/alanine import family NSS transporter small subunit [Intrasporangium sp.]
MSAAAIVMMLLAMLVLWGGLALAILNLNRSEEGEVAEVHRDL